MSSCTPSIYWSPSAGARELRGSIRDLWGALGWEASALGYPVTDELVAPDGRGRYVDFERGSVYWSPQTGAHETRCDPAALARPGRGAQPPRLPDERRDPALYVQFSTSPRGEIWCFRDTGEVRVRCY